MDETPLQPIEANAPPGRRTRRRRSQRRRILRVLEPFLILAVLGVLSTGIVRVVESRVPTSAAAKDSRRLERSQAMAREEVRSLAASLDEDWIPVVGGVEDDAFEQMLLSGLDPLTQLERSPWRKPGLPRSELDPSDPEAHADDQFEMPINSTSNTSAAPPGMLGGAPASP